MQNSSLYFENLADLHPVLFSVSSFTHLIIKVTILPPRTPTDSVFIVTGLARCPCFHPGAFYSAKFRAFKWIFHVANPAAEAAINCSEVSDGPSSQSGAWRLVRAAERGRGLVWSPRGAAAAGGSLAAATAREACDSSGKMTGSTSKS